MESIFTDFIITALIYLLPPLTYLCLRDKPLSDSSIKKVSWLFAIITFVVIVGVKISIIYYNPGTNLEGVNIVAMLFWRWVVCKIFERYYHSKQWEKYESNISKNDDENSVNKKCEKCDIYNKNDETKNDNIEKNDAFCDSVNNEFQNIQNNNVNGTSKKTTKIIILCVTFFVLIGFVISVALLVPIFSKYSFSNEEVSLIVDESTKITIYNPYINIKTLPYLETDDTEIISIKDYKITALNAGNATVRLMSDGKVHDECIVKVEHIKPKNIFFVTSGKNVCVNEGVDIKVGFSPSNVTDKEVSYKISDDSIAKIEGARLIGLKMGSVKVTVIHKTTGLSCSKDFNIISSVPEILRIDTNSEVNIGETFIPGIYFSPYNIPDKSFVLSSSDPSILFVNDNEVTAKNIGTAILTVKHSSGICSSIVINVNPILPSSVSLTVSGKTNMIINTSSVVLAEIVPNNATNKTVKWSSSDSSIATVDQNGVVLAKSPGMVRITATLHNGISSYIDFIVNTTPVNQKEGFIKAPSYECVAPVSVHAPSDESCYVYFKSLTDHQKDFSIFVSAKSTVEIDAPLGKYKLYYATGETWYGTEYRFGIGTDYYTSNKEFDFRVIGDYVYGTELTLYAVAYGNLDTHKISENEFPE